jgi:RimJ/RimL family protein N-acetyltransferase
VEYGIQRRSTYLVPPESEDLPWLFDQFDVPEVYMMFGFDRPSKLRMMRQYRSGNIVVALIKKAETKKRIGFAVMFPPAGNFDFWEFGYAIPEVLDRDAFSALNATDAMAHYMFEHLRVAACGWRTREDNRSADAVVRRLGYEPKETMTIDGHNYTFYRLSHERWMQRKEKLMRGEVTHPSGIGEAFVTLPEYPFEPLVPKQPPK